jgi:hypothetical protein
MDVRDTLSALLPPPRDDEPAGLRQDILDELGDHLACAYNRELLRGVDSSVARQRVIERFGDPAAVARRLWLDAMKGKIMAQRVVIATCLVVMLACLSLVGLMWFQSSRAAAQTTEANRKLAEALVQAQTTNKEMLTKLTEMSEAIRHPRSPDWNPVKFIVTENTLDGPPAAACSITLIPRAAGNTQISRTSDASGVVDFGLVHPGEYSYQISKSLNRGELSGSGDLNVAPGGQVSQRIVWPKTAFAPVPVRIRCDWPPDLEKEGLVVDAPFASMPVEKDGVSWNFGFGAGIGARSVLCGPGIEMKEILNPWGLYLWATSSRPDLRAAVLTSEVRTINERAEPMKWECGTYQFAELIVLRPQRSPAVEGTRLQFEILVRCYPPHTNGSAYTFLREPPSDQLLETRIDMLSGGGTQMGVDGLHLSERSWSELGGHFNAVPDRVNEWTITLPEELIKVVREVVKTDRTPKPQ